jgi:hypothetical protein
VSTDQRRKKERIWTKIKNVKVKIVAVSKKLTVLKEFPREIPNGFINGFKRTRNLPLGSFLGTCLPVVKTWYMPECRKYCAGYFGIGRLKGRVRISQKKLQRRFFGDKLLKALGK